MAKLNYRNRTGYSSPSPRLLEKAAARLAREEHKKNVDMPLFIQSDNRGLKNLSYLKSKGVLA